MAPNLHPFRWTAATAFGVALASAAVAAPPQAPTALLVDDAVSPIGTRGKPVFAWQINDPDPHEIQTRFQIRVASSAEKLRTGKADVWDSGEVAGRQQSHVAYAGPALAADHAYFWQVRTWDKTGRPGPFSLPATFVVGPLANEDWAGASWIRRPTDAADDYTYYRKAADIPGGAVRRATVYVTSVHKYELFLNGQRIGTGPAYQYPQYQYYNGYDVTSLIKPGRNVFALFNHWFGGGQGRATSARGVLLKAVVHYTDGRKVVVGTDATWKQSPADQWILGQRQRGGEGVGYIERIEARRLRPEWNQVSFDDGGWTAAEVIGAPPVEPWVNPLQPDLTRIVETEIAAASVREIGPGSYLIDLGKVYAGRPKIALSGGLPGGTVTVTGGYALGAEGRIDPTKNQNTDLRFFVELSGGDFTFLPAEYYGMRYVQVDGAPEPITADGVRFLVRHSDLDETRSSFMSSDATVNAVWDLMKRSLPVCAQEEYVDTPTREKGGFLGDGAVMSTVAMPVFHERLLTRRQLNEFIASMDQFWSTEPDRGRINAVYPNNDGGRDIPDYTQAFLVWVWDYYMETGDLAFLKERYAHLKAVAEYVQRSRAEATGLITNLPGGRGPYAHGIIDWPASMRYGYDMETAARAVVNHWAYADNDVMSKIAEAVGNAADRDLYRRRANDLAAAINERLLNADGVYIDGLKADGSASTHASQHANMFPLALGFVPPERRAAVTAKVKELQMRVGMVTVLFLIRGLGEAGEGEHLIELLTNAEWPGWARTLAKGGTATWESWTSDTDGNSQSHAWGAAGLEAHVRYILGIKPSRPGYEEVRIQPLDFGTRLTSARGTIATDRGEISVAWNRTADRYSLTAGLPANVSSFVYLPKGTGQSLTVRVDGKDVAATAEGDRLRVPVGSGTHTIERSLK